MVIDKDIAIQIVYILYLVCCVSPYEPHTLTRGLRSMKTYLAAGARKNWIVSLEMSGDKGIIRGVLWRGTRIVTIA